MRFSKKNQKSAQSVLMLDILAIITFALVACGSDSVSDAVNPSPVSEVETRFELGKCTNELEGTSVYVTQERGDYICKNNIWTRDGGGEYYPLSSDLSVYSSSSFLKYSSIMSYSLSSSSFSFEKSQSSSSEEKSSSQIKSSSSSIYSSSSFLKYSSITSYSLSSSSFSSEKSQSSSFEEKSSSQVKSSSSSIDVFSSDCESSSSSKMKEAWNFLNKNISYGEITDSRDGQVYKTVEIGDQVWMAENLNFDYNESVTATSFCYNNRADSCLKYGRLYTWVAAMKACPDEWHVPTDREWETLINFDKNCGPDGKCLKSVNGWNRAGATNGGGGRDDYGFAILPAGYRNDKDRGAFSSIGTYAKFWTAIEIGPNYAKYIDAYVMDVYSNSISIYKNNAHSVRCIKGARQVSNLREPVLYDYMTDSRDGQVYPIVTIGTQTWMAQNLNYDNRDKNKQHFTWKTALTSCPDGWHLPSNAEWNILIEYVGGDELKLRYIQSWSTNGTDDYLFSAKYTDYRGYGDGAYFWSSTKENGSTYALFMGHPVRLDKEAENNMRSVRCLKNFD